MDDILCECKGNFRMISDDLKLSVYLNSSNIK
jgi:hypothetical protein